MLTIIACRLLQVLKIWLVSSGLRTVSQGSEHFVPAVECTVLLSSQCECPKA